MVSTNEVKLTWNILLKPGRSGLLTQSLQMRQMERRYIRILI